MNRILIIALALILLLSGGVIFLAHKWKAADERADQEHSNYIAMAAENSGTVRELTMSRAQFKEVHSKDAAKLDSMGYELRRVKGLHNIKWVWKVDTVLKYLKDIALADEISNELHWQYSQECLNADVIYMSSTGELAMKMWGEVPVTITTVLDRPKRWLIKLKWNAAKWPVKTIVDNPCGMTIKENVRFKIE